MRKIKLFLSFLVIIFAFQLLFPTTALAATCTYTFDPPNPAANRPVKFTISIPGGFNQADRYRMRLVNDFGRADQWIPGFFPPVNGKVEFQAGGQGAETRAGLHTIAVRASSDNQDKCTFTYTINPVAAGCSVDRLPKEPGVDQSVTIDFSNFPLKQGSAATPDYGRWFAEITPSHNGLVTDVSPGVNNVSVVAGNFKSDGTYTVLLKARRGLDTVEVCRTSFAVGKDRGDQSKYTVTAGETFSGFGIDKFRCGPTNTGLETALGCIPVGDSNEFVGWFLKWALGIAGGVAFILMIMAGFQIMTAGGNPEKVQGGRELLNAAISGLVLIIFSIFLLKLIGVDILGLPGFGP